MELKLEHLQAYPLGKDGIKVMVNEDGLREIWDIDEDMTHTQNQYYIKSIDFDLKVLQLVSVVDERYSLDEMELKWISLVVLSLSDLTKEIEVNGEKFVPIAGLLKNEYPSQDKEGKYSEISVSEKGFPNAYFTYQANRCFTIYTNHIGSTSYWVIEKLFEWHFDIYNLIENGLAIDVNTLKPSPNQKLTK